VAGEEAIEEELARKNIRVDLLSPLPPAFGSEAQARKEERVRVRA
jgi:hypothetical protein